MSIVAVTDHSLIMSRDNMSLHDCLVVVHHPCTIRLPPAACPLLLLLLSAAT